jgi:hypothetical protein
MEYYESAEECMSYVLESIRNNQNVTVLYPSSDTQNVSDNILQPLAVRSNAFAYAENIRRLYFSGGSGVYVVSDLGRLSGLPPNSRKVVLKSSQVRPDALSSLLNVGT